MISHIYISSSPSFLPNTAPAAITLLQLWSCDAIPLPRNPKDPRNEDVYNITVLIMAYIV